MAKRKTINWAISPRDAEIISRIVDRAVKLAASLGVSYGREDCQMDITAAHLNGCPLRLAELLAADDGNFGHDIFGIRWFIDRGTGKIDSGLFNPRFSAPVGVSDAR